MIDLGILKKVSQKGGKRGYSIYELLLKNVNSFKRKAPKSPQTKNPLRKPVSEVIPTTKKESIFLKKKQNIEGLKTPQTFRKLTLNDVCLSNSIIIKNDKQDLLNRFGQDYLDWLIEKVKRITNNPKNPIGLLIHMLRIGAYAGEYSDIQKKRKANQEFQKQLKEKKEAERKQRDQEHQWSLHLVDQAQQKAKSNPVFKGVLQKTIEMKRSLLGSFLAKKLGSGFKPSDVIDCPDSLYLFCDDIALILKQKGSVAIEN